MGIEDTCMNEKQIDQTIKDFHMSLAKASYRAKDLLDIVLASIDRGNYQEAYRAFQDASKVLYTALIENKLKEVKNDAVRD